MTRGYLINSRLSKLILFVFIFLIQSVSLASLSDPIKAGILIVKRTNSPDYARTGIVFSKTENNKYQINLINFYLNGLGKQLVFSSDEVEIKDQGRTIYLSNKDAQTEFIVYKDNEGKIVSIRMSYPAFNRIETSEFKTLQFKGNLSHPKIPVGAYQLSDDKFLLLEWHSSTHFTATIHNKYGQEKLHMEFKNSKISVSKRNHTTLVKLQSEDKIFGGLLVLNLSATGKLKAIRMVRSQEPEKFFVYSVSPEQNEMKQNISPAFCRRIF